MATLSPGRTVTTFGVIRSRTRRSFMAVSPGVYGLPCCAENRRGATSEEAGGPHPAVEGTGPTPPPARQPRVHLPAPKGTGPRGRVSRSLRVDLRPSIRARRPGRTLRWRTNHEETLSPCHAPDPRDLR